MDVKGLLITLNARICGVSTGAAAFSSNNQNFDLDDPRIFAILSAYGSVDRLVYLHRNTKCSVERLTRDAPGGLSSLIRKDAPSIWTN